MPHLFEVIGLAASARLVPWDRRLAYAVGDSNVKRSCLHARCGGSELQSFLDVSGSVSSPPAPGTYHCYGGLPSIANPPLTNEWRVDAMDHSAFCMVCIWCWELCRPFFVVSLPTSPLYSFFFLVGCVRVTLARSLFCCMTSFLRDIFWTYPVSWLVLYIWLSWMRMPCFHGSFIFFFSRLLSKSIWNWKE